MAIRAPISKVTASPRALDFGLPERRVDHSDQTIILEGFFKETGCPQLHGFDGKRDIAMSGHDHDRKRTMAGLHPFQQLDAVDARHAHVRDNASKVEARNRVEKMMGGFEQRDMEAR